MGFALLFYAVISMIMRVFNGKHNVELIFGNLFAQICMPLYLYADRLISMISVAKLEKC